MGSTCPPSRRGDFIQDLPKFGSAASVPQQPVRVMSPSGQNATTHTNNTALGTLANCCGIRITMLGGSVIDVPPERVNEWRLANNNILEQLMETAYQAGGMMVRHENFSPAPSALPGLIPSSLPRNSLRDLRRAMPLLTREDVGHPSDAFIQIPIRSNTPLGQEYTWSILNGTPTLRQGVRGEMPVDDNVVALMEASHEALQGCPEQFRGATQDTCSTWQPRLEAVQRHLTRVLELNPSHVEARQLLTRVEIKLEQIQQIRSRPDIIRTEWRAHANRVGGTGEINTSELEGIRQQIARDKQEVISLHSAGFIEDEDFDGILDEHEDLEELLDVRQGPSDELHLESQDDS